MLPKYFTLHLTQHSYNHLVGVPEWLSGMTRNHVGFARAGSNPAAHVSLLFCFGWNSALFFHMVIGELLSFMLCTS